MNLYNLSILCFGFCSFLLGLFVWFKRGDKIGKRYFGMASFYSGWAISIAINLNNDVSYDLGLFMGRLGNGFAVFIPVTWYHFATTYAGSSQPKRNLLKALYAISILIACLSFSSWFIPEVKSMVGFKYYSQAGPLFLFFAVLFFTVVPLSFVELYKKMRISSGYERQQLKGLFIASLIGYIGGSPTFLPSFGIPFPQYTLILLPFYPFMLAYFMIKQKLFDVEELAQAAHRDKLTAIGVLAASINHEVKNPLFIIKGLAESCLERQKEGIFPNEKKALESANDAMKRSMEQADRAMDIIKRLSLFAKAGIDSEIKFEPVKIAQVIEDILPLVRYELAAHGIALTRDMPPDLPEVCTDRRYLEEILFNLIVNAIQALKGIEKSGEIKVGAATEKDKVVVTIQDNGPGIPVDKLKDVFRPFYTTKTEGTGLGLYITQQLVEKIHGRIEVRSEVSTGTKFSVLLPGCS
ncbi:MAG: ATP-binding protein [Candidatus Omnitrophota bacterium]